MEETVTVFDWNLVWAIPLGIIIGAGIMWFWLKRGNGSEIVKSNKKHLKELYTNKPLKSKKHKEGEIPDSDWAGATFADTGAELPQEELKPKHLAPVTPSNHESQLG
jgi:hypothetical protein